MGRATDRRKVLRVDAAAKTAVRRPDTLSAEEPLEIRVGPGGPAPRRPLAVTMRTPGDDLDLALGFLLTEGVIRDAEDVVTAQLCAGTDTPNTYNVVDVVLADGVPPPDTDPARTFYTTSSCGVCGKASIDAIRTRSRWRLDRRPDHRRRARRWPRCPTAAGRAAGVRPHRRPARRRSVHRATASRWCVREDVGRHNAVDKVVGLGGRASSGCR